MSIPYEATTSAGGAFIDLGSDVAAAILATIAAGWQLASKQPGMTPTTLEVPLTELLRTGMREALKGNLPWGERMIVLRGSESMSNPDLDRPDGITDIPIMIVEIFTVEHEHDPHAVIECKRIAANKRALLQAYVSDGIDRFVSGKYSSNHLIGFMIGYVIAGTATAAVAGVNDILAQSGRQREALKPIAPTDWESSHDRTSSRPITLKHCMVSTLDNA